MKKAITAAAIVLVTIFSIPQHILAESAEELRKAIAEHNSQIDQLNKEIAQYQEQLTKVSAAKQTLQSTLSQLNLQIKKVTATVNVTKNQIGATQLQIQELQQGINGKQDSISKDAAGLAQSVRDLADAEKQTLAVQILSDGSLSDVWKDADNINSLQAAVSERIRSLQSQKKLLTNSKEQQEMKQQELLRQKATLVSQQGSLNATKAAQSDLLVQTRSQESTFQKIIADKKQQEASFEMALNDLKSQLQRKVDLSDLASLGTGALRWPVDNVRITQYFGNTPFAKSGAYNGKGHNGIDFAAPIGSPIRAAGVGRVIGTGNTDIVRGCYSFGKWVMVQHENGLNTMYAHLSQIGVSTGQAVSTGDVLGYSGETGYATGPHLHFGVYVSSATQIMKLGDATKSTTACSGATMPITPVGGYLNPLTYLPS